MELEIEEDPAPVINQAADKVRSFRCEESAANLEPSRYPLQGRGKRKRVSACLHIERN
jgi:hypothetical protein